MIDSKCQSLYQRWVVSPLLKSSFIAKQSPMLLTLMGLFFGLCVPFFLYRGWLLTPLLALTLSGFLDTLDGSIARLQKNTSPQGAALDITSDRIVEFSLILGLYLYEPHTRALGCLLMLGSILFCITTFLVVGVFTHNQSEKSFHYSPGLIERAEAFLLFGMMIAFPKGFQILAILFALLVALTGVIRLKQFFINQAKSKKNRIF